MPKARASRRTAFSREHRETRVSRECDDSRDCDRRSTTEDSSCILSRKKDSTKNNIRRPRGATGSTDYPYSAVNRTISETEPEAPSSCRPIQGSQRIFRPTAHRSQGPVRHRRSSSRCASRRLD